MAYKFKGVVLAGAHSNVNGKKGQGKGYSYAGESWGLEIHPEDFYVYPNGGWDEIWRYDGPKAKGVNNMMVDMVLEACKNKKVGYCCDIKAHWTLWKKMDAKRSESLKLAGPFAGPPYSPRHVSAKCETDCSALLATCIRFTGIWFGINAMSKLKRDDSRYGRGFTNTYAFHDGLLKACGYKRVASFSGADRCNASKIKGKLKKGDIILNIYNHTEICVHA